MKYSLALALAAATPTALAGPVSFDLRSKNMPQLNLASYIMKPVANLLDGIDKRDAVPNNLTLTPSYNFYITNISLGTPGQEVEVGFDTGSPYMWAYGPNGSYNNAQQFYPSKSSSYKDQHKNFTVAYGAGYMSGKWGQDNIQVGEYTLEDFPFGVVEQFTVSAGVPGLIGIGPGSNLTNQPYSNVPDAFYKKGVTDSPIFSVFLDNDSSNGGVIFGGYDPTKFEKPIYSYDIALAGQNTQDYYYQLRVESVALDGEDYTVSNVAVLDTGSPFCQLPPGFVNKLGKKLGLTPYDKYQAYYAPKNVTIEDLTETVSINIGKFKVDIPVKDLFVPGEYLWVDDGPKNVKALGIMGAPSYVLGDVFFKHVYAAFDSVNSKVYLAKSTHDFTKSEVKELKGAQFPGAVAGVDPSSQPTGPATLTPRPPASTGAPNSPHGGGSPDSPGGGAAPGGGGA